MQAITTRYIGATSRSNPRIKATGWRGDITLAYDSAYDAGENHRLCAQALLDLWNAQDDVLYHAKYGHHDSELVIKAGGELPDNNKDGYAFIVKHRTKKFGTDTALPSTLVFLQVCNRGEMGEWTAYHCNVCDHIYHAKVQPDESVVISHVDHGVRTPVTHCVECKGHK